jgi:hypothetical protein
VLAVQVAGGSEKYGIEQEHLNNVFGAHVRITARRSANGPGIKFLQYLTPTGGRTLPLDTRAPGLGYW